MRSSRREESRGEGTKTTSVLGMESYSSGMEDNICRFKTSVRRGTEEAKNQMDVISIK